MVHLVVYLVHEYQIGGPILYRWMYSGERYNLFYVHWLCSLFNNYITMSNCPCKPWLMIICRSLGEFKSNVQNKVAPEGCIAEGYIATELVTFWSRYLDNAPSFLNHLLRNPDGLKGMGTRVSFNCMTLTQIHWYIMFNSDDFFQLRM